MHHTHLSDEELVSQLASLCLEGRRLVARLIVHLIEVEDRSLDKKASCSSMWDFCVRRLGMSHGETSRRLTAMKLVRRFPSLLGRIERGQIHLSSLKILGKHLDESNVEALLDEAAGKSKMEVQEIVARHYPRPNAPEIMMEIPAAPVQASLGNVPTTATMFASAPIVASAPRAHIEPTSATTYLVQMNMTKEGWEDLKRVKDLMSHRIPNGETVAVIESALKLLREKLENERMGKTSRPQSKPRPTKPGYISRATRREVFERDGEQCTFVDAQGNRCECRTRLELDHIVPRAKGGTDEASNLRVLCRGHNRHEAEEVFGKEHVAEKIHCRQRQAQRVKEEARVMTAMVSAAPVPSVEAAPPVAPAESTPSETIELASRGLVKLGFAKADVKRAVDAICAKRAGEAMPVQALLREAIAVLT